MATFTQPKPHRDDFELDDKLSLYRTFLFHIRHQDDIPEDLRLRRFHHLKDEVLPFW